MLTTTVVISSFEDESVCVGMGVQVCFKIITCEFRKPFTSCLNVVGNYCIKYF